MSLWSLLNFPVTWPWQNVEAEGQKSLIGCWFLHAIIALIHFFYNCSALMGGGARVTVTPNEKNGVCHVLACWFAAWWIFNIHCWVVPDGWLWLFSSSVLLDGSCAATTERRQGLGKDREDRHFTWMMVRGKPAPVLAGLRREDVCSMTKRFVLINRSDCVWMESQ